MKFRRIPAVLVPVLVPVLVTGSLALSLSAQKPAAPEKPDSNRVAPGTYQIDAVHSSILFRAKHLGTSWFYGAFKDASGSITIDPRPEACKVEVEIDAESVDTRDGKRDGHLKSADFLDAKQFPTANFKSRSVKKAGARGYVVAGDFSLHGVTKPVTIEMEETGFSDSRMGVRAGFHGVLTIRRADYGITYSTEAVSDEVQLTLSIEAIQTEAQRK